MNVIEPPLDRTFIYDSYACRRDKGVHKAVDRYRALGAALRLRPQDGRVAIFPLCGPRPFSSRSCGGSIGGPARAAAARHPRGHRSRDRRAAGVFPGDDLFTPLARRTGIPIGNLTSQFSPICISTHLDHYLKETLRVGSHLRYVDDLVMLDDDKVRLHAVREQVRAKLAEARLRLHPNKAHITHAAQGLDLLGYFVFPHRRRLRNDNGHRFARRLRRFAGLYRSGRLAWDDFNPSVQSWLGHARHADTLGLRRRIFSETVFVRGWAEGRQPRDPRRRVEQQTEEPALGVPQQQDAGQPQRQQRFPPRQSARAYTVLLPGAVAFTDAPVAARGCP